MTTPAPRNPVRIARGLYNDLLASVIDIKEGEICFAQDSNELYVKESGVLTLVIGGVNSSAVREAIGIDQTGEPMGHADISTSSISFNQSTRLFSIAPTGSSFDVWCRGVKFTFFGAQTVTIPNSTGLYYIFFDENGDINYQTSFFNLQYQAPTAYVYWNATEGQAVYLGDERHGIVLDWQTHEYLHRTRGAVFANGFDVSGYTVTGDGSIDAHAQLSLSGGTFFDEDLEVNVTHSETPVANTFQQHLTNPALIPVLRRDGQSWVRDSATNFPLQVGSVYPRYNKLNGSNWASVDAGVNKYIVYYIVATNNVNNPVLSIQGQDQYSNLGDAQDAIFAGLDLSGFPSLEFRALYQVIYQVGAYPNSPNARLRDVIDTRGESSKSSAISGGGTVISINQLTDVDTSSTPPVEKDALIWDDASNNWVPGRQALGDLFDVNTIGKIEKSVLTYDQTSGMFVANDVNTVITITDGGNF